MARQIRKFKRELPDYEMYDPVQPCYNDDEDNDIEDARRQKKKFRCPFRREDDGSQCNKDNEKLNEILNHFYKFHFTRICAGNVFEENLNCFFTKCHDTFSTHDKLVKHIHKHEDGKESLFYIKYLIDNLENEKKEGLNELKTVFQAEKRDVEDLLNAAEMANEKLDSDHQTKIVDMETESNAMEIKLKGDIRYYRKKSDDLKKKNEDGYKKMNEEKSQFEEVKRKNENLLKEHAAKMKTSEEAQTMMKGKISDLKEKNSELKGKHSILQETNKMLNNKLEKLNRKLSDHGPNSESSLAKRNARLEKQLDLAKKQIKAKESELKQKDNQIFKLSFEDEDSLDGSPKPSSTTSKEYVEDSD
eukprot:GFUD01070916.1.p1 GENE.GFUD01070916.1~~GFUD01070916.1.p1  ORF type:complete len:360 (-),score=118.72 GFUD01070916.1:482-1561(-)